VKTDKLALLGGDPVVHYRPHPWPPVTPSAKHAVLELLERGELSYYGREGRLADLEDAFANYHGMQFALGVSSGTAALHSAFVGCGVGPGDEVIAPTHTFLATVTPIIACNGIPVLVDCEEDTETIDPLGIERAITPRTKAIVITHLWGHPAEMDSICDIARRHRVRLVEDCSHAHGATYKGRLVGTFGDVSCFSLQAKKIVSAGQGGILLTNDKDIYERAVLFGHFRARAEECVTSETWRPFIDTGFGLNYRMHSLAAALALADFAELDARIEARTLRLQRLSTALQDVPGVCPPLTRSHVTRGAWYGYKVRWLPEALGIVSLDAVIAALQAEGCEVHRPGSQPLHLSPLFSGTHVPFTNFTASDPASRPKYKLGDLPISERVHFSSLSLPTFTFEPLAIVDEYAAAFAKVAEHLHELETLHPHRDQAADA
jgi:perosamine synthetase